MDLASLREAAANLTLYDLKAGVRKVQNGRSSVQPAGSTLTVELVAVMNYTEMEAKVREATNNEPWVSTPEPCQCLENQLAQYTPWRTEEIQNTDFLGRVQVQV